MNRTDIFNWVRDIPFKLPLGPNEQDYCCDGKHTILLKLLRNIGMQVRPRYCEFDWREINTIPKKILSLTPTPIIDHLYLEFKYNQKYNPLDATWDSPLSDIFPISNWDGKTETEIAVPYKKIYSPEKSLEMYQIGYSPEAWEREQTLNTNFNRKFNKWLGEVRKS